MRKTFRAAVCMLAAFALWTAAVCCIDVRPIGPKESAVGFAALNGFFHRLTGTHMSLYVLTDWLSLVPLGITAGFAALGLMQWIRRRSILKVDGSILWLGGFYIAMAAAYALFERFAVNYRPVLIDGCLEASYPSSTTVLVLCVMPTAAMQCKARIKKAAVRRCALAVMTAFAVLMVVCRLISGVHWLTDIIGGALLSAGLVKMYSAVCGLKSAR